MTVEAWRGYVAPTVAAIIMLVCLAMAFISWTSLDTTVTPPKDIAILFGFLGIVSGNASGYLFASEAANQGSRSAERVATNAAAAATTPNVDAIDAALARKAEGK